MATATHDFYDVLGVERGASADDIRRAYRKLARKYHPDVSREPEAEDRFKEVSEAYDVLSDPEKRERYDRAGAGRPQAGAATGGPGYGGFSAGDDDLADLFETFLGGGVVAPASEASPHGARTTRRSSSCRSRRRPAAAGGR